MYLQLTEQVATQARARAPTTGVKEQKRLQRITFLCLAPYGINQLISVAGPVQASPVRPVVAGAADVTYQLLAVKEITQVPLGVNSTMDQLT